jgi:signal transduction histidine kinase/ligand-binding sensor domain-containing protein
MTRPRLIVALLLAINPLTAQFITTDISQYAHSAWLEREGAFRGGNRAITQTSDGYLWLVSSFGLLRFDGNKFSPGTPTGAKSLIDRRLGKVFSARDGSLWITGDGLRQLKSGRVRAIAELEGARVDSILEDHDGTIWVGARTPAVITRLCRICGVTTECFGESKTFGVQINTLFEDKAGNLWVSAETGVWRWAPGKSEFFPKRHGAAAIAIDRNDLMVAAATSRAPQPLTRIPLGSTDLSECVFLTDRQGGLWIGTRGYGLLHSLHGRIDTYKSADGLSSNSVLDIFEDREENIWTVTTNGIDRFHRQAITLVTTKQGLSSDPVVSVLLAGNTMWVATHHGLNRVREGDIRSFMSFGGVSTADLSTLFLGANGKTLIATGPPDGFAWVDHDRITSGHVSLGSDTYAVAEDEADGLWLSNRQSGLVHVPKARGPVETFPWTRFDRKAAQAMAFDPLRRGLWLAFHRGDLVFFRDGQMKERRIIANKALQNPRNLRVDADGTVWVGSDAGLSRLRNGEVATLGSGNGLPCDGVHWRQDDDRNATWLETECGIVQLAPGELDRWSRDPKSHIKIQTYLDNIDGAQNTFFGGHYNPLVSMTLDGRLAYGTDSGLASIDPHQMLKNLHKPPVHIDSVEADGKKYAVEKTLALPPNIHVVRLAYSALSFRAPQKVRFKYKLDGYDTRWSEILSTREAVYTNLPPREYAFHVVACNDSGIWNDVGDTVTFSVRAAFYQTRSFLFLCAGSLAAMLWFAYRARVSYLCREVSTRIRAQIGERLNISRDLHDTLLQGVQGLILSFHALSEDPKVDPAVRKRIANLSGRAEEVLKEGREKIRTLRFEHHPNRSFVQEIRQLSRLINPDDSPPLELSTEGEEVPLDPLVFEEVCLICREALNNAYRHSGAAKIDVTVTYARSRFSVDIRDDGRGLPTDVRQAGLEGHWGIVGMNERAAGIGARFEIKTPHPDLPRPGTRIAIDLPAVLAYATPKNA